MSLGIFTNAIFSFVFPACPKHCKPRDKCKLADLALHVDVKYFQLTNIVIHNDVMERFMENLLLVEKNLREKHIQNATVIRKQTDGKVKYFCQTYEWETTRYKKHYMSTLPCSRYERFK
jgi:hypothetical protein